MRAISHKLLLAGLLLFPSSFVACGGGDPDEPSPTPVTPDSPNNPTENPTDPTNPQDPDTPYLRVVAHDGDVQQIVLNWNVAAVVYFVETNRDDWTVTCDKSWCRAEKGIRDVTIRCDDYYVDEGHPLSRTCTVTFRSGTQQLAAVQVVQDPSITSFDFVDNTPFYVSAAGGTYDLKVYTNVLFWKAETDASWFTVTKLDDGTLRLEVKPRGSGDTTVRSGTVYYQSQAEFSNRQNFSVYDQEPVADGEDYGYGDYDDWD